MDNYKQKLFLLCALLFGCVLTSVGVEYFATPDAPIKIEAPRFVGEQEQTKSSREISDKSLQNTQQQNTNQFLNYKSTNVTLKYSSVSQQPNNKNKTQISEAYTVININTAAVEELDTLPGVGPAIAQKIVEFRKGQPFTKIEDIMLVKGIGKKKFARMRERITVE